MTDINFLSIFQFVGFKLKPSKNSYIIHQVIYMITYHHMVNGNIMCTVNKVAEMDVHRLCKNTIPYVYDKWAIII